MARKDIEIRVRAKDDASRNAKKIADALKLIGQDGKKAMESAGRVGSAFSALTADVAKLKAQTDGLTAFSKVVGQMERAGDSVSRLGTQIASASKDFGFLRTRSQEAAAASAEVTARLKAEEAALASRNVDLKTATAALQAQKQALLELAKAQDVLNGKSRKGVSAGGGVATAGVGIESGAPQSSARASFAAFLAADVAAIEAEKAQLQGTVAGLKTSIESSQKSVADLSAQLKTATANEKEFSKETTEAGNAVLALRADLAKAKGNLAGLEEEVLQANQALGTLAFTQADVAAAAARATAELRQQERALAVFEKFAGKRLVGGGTLNDPTSAERATKQAEAFRNAREELEILRTEQAKLDAALKASSGNVTSQVDAYNRMSRAVKLAEEQIRKLEIAQRLSETTGQKTGYGKWIASYEKSTQQAAAATDRFTNANNRAGAAAGRVGPQVIRVSHSKRQLANDTNKATQALTLFGNETRTTLSFMQRMRGEVIALAASYIGLFGAYQRVTEAANAYRAVERAQQNLGVAFAGDTAKVAQEMAFLNAEADRLGFTFQTLADGYGKISVGAQSAGFSIADTRQLFVSIIEAARVSGQSIEQTNGILRAFDQILSKGKIQAEELRGQLGDRMTGAFKLFADALGVTTAELDEMLKKGDVLADRDTLIKVAERLAAVYGGQLPQALASVGFAMDQFGRTIEKINLLMAEGLVDSIKEASNSLAAFVNSEEGQATFRSIGEAAGFLITVLAQIPEYLDVIVLAAQAVIAIKLAQWASNFGGSVSDLIANVGRLNREITLIGPRTQQMAASQGVLATAIGSAGNAMAVGQRRLRAYNSTTALSRGIVLGLSGALGVLRATMLTVTSIARVMWAAIGGPIGAAIIAVSVVYANWESDADRATAALSAHETQVGRVRQAYGLAQGNVEDWAAALEGMTKLDAEASLLKLTESYRSALSEIEGEVFAVRDAIARIASSVQPGDLGVLVELQKLDTILTDLQNGSRPIDEIKQALSDIVDNSTSDAVVDLAKGLNETIGAAGEGETSIYNLSKAIESAKAVLGLFSEETREAAEETLGLNEVVETTDETMGSAAGVEAYTKAIEELRSKIPSLADEMERLQKTTELNAAAWTALVAAWNSGDLSKIKEVAGLWLRGIGDMGSAELERTRGITGSFASKVAQVESGGVATAKNPLSTATGLGQFIESTWLSMFKKYFPDRAASLTDAAILELRKNADVSMQMIDLYAQENAAVLRRFGVEINDANLYLAHFLGSGGASKLLTADRSTPIADLFGSDVISANQSVLGGGATAGDVVAWAQRKMGISQTELQIVTEINRAETERAETAREQAESTSKRLADLDAEISQQELINAGKEREAAIEAAIREARAENPNISEEELAKIREKTALLFDQQNAQSGIELSEERVNQLYELRSQLVEQMKMAEESGDVAGVERLRLEIEAVNMKLQEAITKAIAMWTAIGGPEADAAIAKLQTMQMGLQNSQTKVGSFGLSMDTWFGIFQGAVQGIVGAFDAFAQAIANGENAFAAFGKAALQVLAQVLQQIAAAIIQMQILKMLQGFGGSIGGFATKMLGSMAGHTGGVVGSRAIGAGNSVGRPDWMRSALTYHTGGMAGFAPDEVSATLKKGEEILTEEDPRHRFNMGGSSSGGKGDRLTQVLAIGEKQIQEMLNQYGSDATLTHIKTNAPTIRRMLGV